MTGTNLGDIYTRTLTNGTQGSWNRFWNNNNDGAGSGLDADLVDGLDVHTGRNDNANKVVTAPNLMTDFKINNATASAILEGKVEEENDP